MTWDSEQWGDPKDYGIVEGQAELDGIKVGQRVRAINDTEEGAFAGDEGVVIGVSHVGAGMFNPQARDDLVVAFDDMDPIGVAPRDVEIV